MFVFVLVFFLYVRLPPISPRTYTRFPYTTLSRSRRRIAHRARFAMPPKGNGDKAEGIGQLMLAGEEAAMRHQAVEQQQRPPRADIVIGDSSAVRCEMVRQRFPLPGALAPVRSLLPSGRPSARL